MHRDDPIRNRRFNEYIRELIAQSYAFSMRDGVIDCGAAIARLHAHLRETAAHQDRDLVNPLVCILTSLGAKEAYDDIVDALDLVDPFLMDRKYVDECFADPERELKRKLGELRPTYIDEVVDVPSRWAVFGTDDGSSSDVDELLSNSRPIAATRSKFAGHFTPMKRSCSTKEPSVAPIVRGPRVGRNDPCPCGSGKKHKRCCGKPT